MDRCSVRRQAAATRSAATVDEKRFAGESVSRVAGYEFKHDYIARLCITDFGREYYRENWQRYKEMYPEVDAPQPGEQTAESE